MIKRIIIGSAFMLLAASCFSQADSLMGRKEVSSAIRISMIGSILYPGASLGLEIPAYSTDILRSSKKKGAKMFGRDRLVSLNASWYHHPDFHDNLYFTAEWIMRRTGPGGFFTEFSPGLGYSRTFLGGTTYEVDNNGNVSIIRAAGYSYAVAKAGVGLGFSFSELKGIPLSLYYDFNMITMFPYNSTIYFRPVMELGLIYKPEYFLPVSIKRKKFKK